MGLNIIDTPLNITEHRYGGVHRYRLFYLPFMVLPIYSSLEKMDYSLIEAAQDLGCTPFAAFWKITFRCRWRVFLAGCFLVFIPAVGEFVIPDLLGGSQTLMIGKTIWSEFFSNRDWPVSSAVAVVLLVLLIVPIVIFPAGAGAGTGKGEIGCRTTGPASISYRWRWVFAFLYLPIVLLVIYSFNESRLVTVWAGFSTKWYGELFRNQALMHAAWVTIRVGLLSATIATVLGTLAALALTRYTRFRGRILFSGMVYAPLVMPDVITGLSLLSALRGDEFRPRFLDRARCPYYLFHVFRGGRGAIAPCQL